MSKQLKDRLNAMGLMLPPAPKPAGVYRPILVIDNQLYVSGQGPVLEAVSYTHLTLPTILLV